MKDAGSHDGACALARQIEAYWLERGFVVKTRIEKVYVKNVQPMFCVRTDMLRGFPQNPQTVGPEVSSDAAEICMVKA